MFPTYASFRSKCQVQYLWKCPYDRHSLTLIPHPCRPRVTWSVCLSTWQVYSKKPFLSVYWHAFSFSGSTWVARATIKHCSLWPEPLARKWSDYRWYCLWKASLPPHRRLPLAFSRLSVARKWKYTFFSSSDAEIFSLSKARRGVHSKFRQISLDSWVQTDYLKSLLDLSSRPLVVSLSSPHCNWKLETSWTFQNLLYLYNFAASS